MAQRIVMPSFGMYTSEGQLVAWLTPDGSRVQAGQPILEIETQKATESVIAPAAGILCHVLPRGAEVKEEGLLGYILAEGETVPKELGVRTLRSERTEDGSSALKSDPSHSIPVHSAPGRIPISPLARRLAKEHGLEPRSITGSGPRGRIVERDVRAAIRKTGEVTSSAGAKSQPGIGFEPLSMGALTTAKGLIEKGLEIHSAKLGKTVRYNVYLPPGYESSGCSFPVIYFLHGYTDNENGWIRFGEIDQAVDECLSRRSIPPAVVVMPDGGTSFYINNYNGSVLYEDFFIEEFMPMIESKYRIRSGSGVRAIGGISMGGFGALAYTLRHPGLFRACVGFSAAVLTDEEVIAEPEARWERVYSNVYGPSLQGSARITELLKSNNPFHLLGKLSPEKLRDVRLYLDCGDNDLFYKGNSSLHVLLRDLSIAHEYRVRGGGHTWSYWRSGIPEALRFLGASFYC